MVPEKSVDPVQLASSGKKSIGFRKSNVHIMVMTLNTLICVFGAQIAQAIAC